MYGRSLAGRVGLVGRTAARQHSHGALKASSAVAHPLGNAGTSPLGTSQHKGCGFSSQAARETGGDTKDEVIRGRDVRRTEEQRQKVAEHKAAVLDYKKKMTALRKEIQQETKERRHTEAVNAALERRRIAKRQAVAFALKREKAAINIALFEKVKAKQKANYEAGFRESARIFREREERKKNIHQILLEELEEESKSWVCTFDDVNNKITDDIWETPGDNSAGGQISMPDDHLWRFSADVGLYDQEEEFSERNVFLRAKMYDRMDNMKKADTYLRDRRTRWDNDTRGLLKHADRLLWKQQPAPPGYMSRLDQTFLEEKRRLDED